MSLELMSENKKVKPNKVIRSVFVDGRRVDFRYPLPGDVYELRRVINTFVEEGTEIAKTTKVTLSEEKKWLDEVLKAIRRKEKIMLVVEENKKLVGSCEITRDPFDVSRHVGTLAVGIQKSIRGLGVGETLVRICLSEAKKKLGLKMIKLYVFHTNKIGRNLYEKIGFEESGRLRDGVFHNGRYKDDIIMTIRI